MSVIKYQLLTVKNCKNFLKNPKVLREDVVIQNVIQNVIQKTRKENYMAGINGFGNNFNNYNKNFRKLTLNTEQNTVAKINAQPLSLTPKTVGDSFSKSLTSETSDYNNGFERQASKKSFAEIWKQNYSEWLHSDLVGGSEMLPGRYRDNEQLAAIDLLYVTVKSLKDWFSS